MHRNSKRVSRCHFAKNGCKINAFRHTNFHIPRFLIPYSVYFSDSMQFSLLCTSGYRHRASRKDYKSNGSFYSKSSCIQFSYSLFRFMYLVSYQKSVIAYHIELFSQFYKCPQVRFTRYAFRRQKFPHLPFIVPLSISNKMREILFSVTIHIFYLLSYKN